MHDGYVYRERADLKKALGDPNGAQADYDQAMGQKETAPKTGGKP